jgi:hypothetical protein
MTDGVPKRIPRHLPAVGLFALLSLAWSFPLVLHLGTHVPGVGPGDNLSCVWNLWWMRTALHHHLNPFYTTYLFYPVGADLTQHTLTPLNGAIAATVLGGLSPAAAQNVLLLVSLFLNGFVAYLLANGVSGSRFAGIAAGVAFGGAAPVLVRLQGHFNLVSAWAIPLSALLFLHAVRRKSNCACLAAGCGLAVAAYCDYYYFLYSAAFIVICLAERWFHVDVHADRRRAGRLSAWLIALLIADLVLIATIALSGGFTLPIGRLQLSMYTTQNPRVAFWALLGLWALSHWRVAIALRLRPALQPHTELRTLSMMSAAFVIVALPLIVATARLLYTGEYTSQHYLWHSAPPGVDLAAFIVGNPLNVLYGSLTRRAYAAIGMNPIEGIAWIPLAALVIVLAGWRRLCQVSEATRWRIAAVVFAVWALGPHLDVFGTSPGLLLPAVVVRWVPFASNARIPGRAAVVVVLAAAMLLAFTLARLAPNWSWRRKALVVSLLLLDCATTPLPLYRPEAPSIYAVLTRLPGAGAVLELPIGLRDGLGEVGHFDTRTLYYQTTSDRPMLGGFVSRLAARVKSWYQNTPVISTVLKLSDPACPADWTPDAVPPRQVYEALTAASVSYVVLDRTMASPRLLQYMSSWPLTRLAADAGRELYVLRQP